MAGKQKQNQNNRNSNNNAKDSFENSECPKKDKDGNCMVPGVHSDSDPIGGG